MHEAFYRIFASLLVVRLRLYRNSFHIGELVTIGAEIIRKQ